MTALLLDFDGTLLDSETSHLQSWEEAYVRHGHVLDRAAWIAGVGGHGPDPAGALQAVAGGAFDPAVRRARELELVHALAPRSGVAELFAAAGATGCRLAVVSSSPRAWVAGHLDRLGLLPSLELVVTREDAVRAKPAPDLYLAGLARLGLPARQAVAVEDSANGVAAARAAGLRVVAVPGPVTAGQDLAHADLRVDSLLGLDLVALCRGVLSRRSRPGRSSL